MKITVFGTGYVGLVTGTCLADAGHNVLCVDVDERKVAMLKNGQVPIYEPGLDELVSRNYQAGRLNFTTDADEAVAFGQLQFIAVGTPPDEDGSADLQYVLAVARTIGEKMADYKVLIDKSTVPVGTADKVRAEVQKALDARNVQVDFDVCSNPEFLKEGAAIADFTQGARVVVGTDAEPVRALMSECYAPFIENGMQMIFMDIRSAELTKYAANAMLATKISFMNEMANLAERLGADIDDVRIGIGTDPRIGFQFINPGCGYGGSCFPKDVQALERIARGVGYDAEILKAVEAVNVRQKNALFEKLCQALDGDIAGRTIAVWGLSFKPNTDDMRDAPSRTLMESIWAAGGRVQAFDPVAMDEARRLYGEQTALTLVAERDAALVGADALVICTEWKQFRDVDFAALKAALSAPVLVDGRNLYDPAAVRAAGLLYFAIGRGDSVIKR